MRYATKVLGFECFAFAISNASVLVLTYYFPPAIILAGFWLLFGYRIIHRNVLPLVFRYVRCTNPDCRYRLPTQQRWKVGKYVHNCVESVWRYHVKGNEIGMVVCPRDECRTTNFVQYRLFANLVSADIVDNALWLSPSESPATFWQYLYRRFIQPATVDADEFVLGTPADQSRVRRPLWMRLLGIRMPKPKIAVPLELRYRHQMIWGASGMGKSSLMLSYIKGDMEAGRGVTVVEPNGKLIRDVLRYVPKHRVDDVVLIRAGDVDCPFQLNPLVSGEGLEKWNTNAELLRTIKAISDSWGSDIEYSLDKAIRSACAVNGSLRDAYDMLTLGTVRDQLVPLIEDERLRGFWDQWRDISIAKRNVTVRKLEKLMEHPVLGRMLGAKKSNFDPAKAIRESQIVLVDLSTQSDTDDVILGAGSVIIRKIKAEAFKQHEDDAVPMMMYIDESRNFMHAAVNWAQIFSEARKKKLGLTMAAQHPHQITGDVLEEVYTNVGTLVSFAVDLDYAKSLAARMPGVSPEYIMLQEKRHCVAKLHRTTHRIEVTHLEEPAENYSALIEQRTAEQNRADNDDLVFSRPVKSNQPGAAVSVVPEAVT